MGLWSTLGGLAGGVGGFFAGGPAGAAAGYGIGSGLGSSFEGSPDVPFPEFSKDYLRKLEEFFPDDYAALMNLKLSTDAIKRRAEQSGDGIPANQLQMIKDQEAQLLSGMASSGALGTNMGIAQLADYQSRATNNAYAQARQQAMQDRLAAAQAEQQFYNAQSQLSAKQQAAMAANREAAGKRDAAMIGRNVAQWEVDRQNKSNFEKQMFGLGVAGLGLAASPNYSWGGSNLGDSYNNAMGTYNNAMGSYNSSMFGPSGGGFSFNVPPPAPLALGNYNFLNPYGGQ